MDEPEARVVAPKPVNVSFGLWLCAGVLLIAGFVVTLAGKDQIIADLVAENTTETITADKIASGTTTALWVLLVGAITYAVLMALFAYKAREGTRSARTVLTVLTAILVIAQLALFPNLVTLASSLVALAAMVLLYLPSVAGYFPRLPRSVP